MKTIKVKGNKIPNRERQTSQSEPCGPLLLRNGTTIIEPLSLALRFVMKDGSYRAYDEPHVAHDNSLSIDDVKMANKIQGRMGPLVIQAIMRVVADVEPLLAQIPAGTCLMASEKSIPWTPLRRVFEIMLNVPEVGLARATKILHKKRPSLIPILDSIVEKYLQMGGGINAQNKPELALELMRRYKIDLDANANTLRSICDVLKRRGINLTECRLLDIYLWAYSGTYLPPFIRRQ
jgi:hypothetical protein